MFTFASDGGEEQIEVEASASSPSRVRHLGLSAFNGGGLVIPALPHSFSKVVQGGGLQDRMHAEFCLAADKNGFPLPKGDFTSIEETLKEQFLAVYRSKATGLKGAPLPLFFTVVADDNDVTIFGEPEQCQPVFLIKDVVEELNALRENLGWWIVDLIEHGHSKGLSTYDPSRCWSLALYTRLYGVENDREFVMEAYCDISDETTPEELLERMKEDFTFYPSVVKKDLGLDVRPAKMPSISNSRFEIIAADLLRGDQLSTKASEVLQAAIGLSQLFRKAERNRYHYPPSSTDCDVIGSIGFVVWDNREMVEELVGHYEQNAYEGDAIEEIFSLRTPLGDPGAWPHFFKAASTFFDMYIAFSNLLLPMEVA